MGSQHSQLSDDTSRQWETSDDEVVSAMMPIYFVKESVTAFDLEEGTRTWNMILDNTSPVFLARRAEPPTSPTAITDKDYSCLSLFHDAFFSRLFDVHPLCRGMFRRNNDSMFRMMFALALSPLGNPAQIVHHLTNLTQAHNDRGVKAVEYGVVGEVLMWALRYCLGGEVYTSDVHCCWLRIISRLLRTMVPVAVKCEIESGRAQEARMKIMQARDTESFASAAQTLGVRGPNVHPRAAAVVAANEPASISHNSHSHSVGNSAGKDSKSLTFGRR